MDDPRMEAPLSREEAIMHLAECLYLKMEQMDPSAHGP